MTPRERALELEAQYVHVPWWEYVDVVPVGLLVDEQLRSLFGYWLARARGETLTRAPGAYGAAEGG